MAISKDWYHTEMKNDDMEILHRSPSVEYSFIMQSEAETWRLSLQTAKTIPFFSSKELVSFQEIL